MTASLAEAIRRHVAEIGERNVRTVIVNEDDMFAVFHALPIGRRYALVPKPDGVVRRGCWKVEER